MSAALKSSKSNRNAGHLGPNLGFKDTVTGTAQYLDLSGYEGREVRVEVRSSEVLVCFVETASVAPVDADVSALTDDQYIMLEANETDYFVVPDNRPFLAYEEGVLAGGGTLRVHVV